MHLIVVVTLLVFAATLVQGRTFQDIEEFYERTLNGIPGSPAAGSVLNKCKRDILIVLDMSTSISRTSFVNGIKPFLQAFVADADLNVNYNDGSQIAMITFSDESKTKRLFNFGKYTTKDELKKVFDRDLTWDALKGTKTRTGLALQIANDDVFQRNSPNNFRPNVKDVLILLTDGKPNGVYSGEGDRALTEIYKLHNKSIQIISIAVGPDKHNLDAKMLEFLKNASSPPAKLVFEADKSAVTPIIKKLVEASCILEAKIPCICADVKSAPFYLVPGQTSMLVTWAEPTLKCESNINQNDIKGLTVHKPSMKSPTKFGPGQHVIMYNYSLITANGAVDKLDCPVNILIKSCSCNPSTTSNHVYYLKPGSSTTSLGQVTWTEPNSSCIEMQQVSVTPNIQQGHSFGIGQHTIAYQYAVGSVTLTCDVIIEVKACSCNPSTTSNHVYYLKPGSSTTSLGQVTWTEPKSSCIEMQLVSVTPNIQQGHSFGIGQHTFAYQYAVGSVTLTCDVIIEVKDCTCSPRTSKHEYYVKPDSPARQVTWPEPKASCTEMKLVSVTQNIQQRHSFGIGQHNIAYQYAVGSVTLTCDVVIEVKVVPCQNQNYDINYKTCCCGKLHTMKANHECCGRKYYDNLVNKCCSLFYNIVSIQATCPGSDL